MVLVARRLYILCEPDAFQLSEGCVVLVAWWLCVPCQPDAFHGVDSDLGQQAHKRRPDQPLPDRLQRHAELRRVVRRRPCRQKPTVKEQQFNSWSLRQLVTVELLFTKRRMAGW